MNGLRVDAIARVVWCGLLAVAVLGGIGARAAEPTGTPEVTLGAAEQALLLQATLERTSDDPVALQLLRLTIEPGGRSPLHAHPGLEFGVVESGRLTVQVAGRAVTLLAGASAAATSQVVPEGIEVTLEPGDRIAYAPGTRMTFRNPGPERTSLLAATILAAGPDAPPGAIYPGGTPSPSDVAAVQSQILGEVVVDELPRGRSVISLERLALRAGASVPGYDGPVLIAVEEGALSGSIVDGALATAAPNGGSDFRLEAGQSMFLPEGMAETPPLGGEGTVVLLRLGIQALREEDVDQPVVTPTAAPAATTVAGDEELTIGTRVVVTVAEARLRAAPSLAAAVLAGLERGRTLVVAGPAEVDEAGQEWYLVEDAADPGLTGYVAAELIAPADQ